MQKKKFRKHFLIFFKYHLPFKLIRARFFNVFSFSLSLTISSFVLSFFIILKWSLFLWFLFLFFFFLFFFVPEWNKLSMVMVFYIWIEKKYIFSLYLEVFFSSSSWFVCRLLLLLLWPKPVSKLLFIMHTHKQRYRERDFAFFGFIKDL